MPDRRIGPYGSLPQIRTSLNQRVISLHSHRRYYPAALEHGVVFEMRVSVREREALSRVTVVPERNGESIQILSESEMIHPNELLSLFNIRISENSRNSSCLNRGSFFAEPCALETS